MSTDNRQRSTVFVLSFLKQKKDTRSVISHLVRLYIIVANMSNNQFSRGSSATNGGGKIKLYLFISSFSQEFAKIHFFTIG